MEFRTKFPDIQTAFKISLTDSLFTMGSCFADEMTSKFNNIGLNVKQSPFGIVFNPLSMAIQLDRIMNLKLFSENEALQHDGFYFSLLQHGKYKVSDHTTWLNNSNHAIQEAHQYLLTTNTLLLTFGSAYYYYHLRLNEVAANCHKIPSNEFQKRIINLDQVCQDWERIVELLQKKNPNLNIILTVSPVRYLRDGFIENQRSKARLIMLAEHLENKYAHIHYYPSYEIFMDDLRDYRFVKKDNSHPNELAIDYIWKHFCDSYFDSALKEAMLEIQAYHNLIQHRMLNENEKTKTEHQQKILELRHKILAKYPSLKLD